MFYYLELFAYFIDWKKEILHWFGALIFDQIFQLKKSFCSDEALNFIEKKEIDEISLKIPVKLSKVKTFFYFVKIHLCQTSTTGATATTLQKATLAKSIKHTEPRGCKLDELLSKVHSCRRQGLYSSVNLDISMELFATLRRGLTSRFNYARFVAIDKRGTFLETKSLTLAVGVVKITRCVHSVTQQWQ